MMVSPQNLPILWFTQFHRNHQQLPLAKVQTLSAKDAGKQRESGLLVNGCESSRERWK